MAIDYSDALDNHEAVNVLMLFFLFFVFTFLGTLIFNKYALMTFGQFPRINDNLERQLPKSSYYPGYSINVVASVPYLLGIKKISDNNDKNSKVLYLLFGNLEKGFFVYDYKWGKIIFTYHKIPGDGIIVSVPREYNDLIFSPYY